MARGKSLLTGPHVVRRGFITAPLHARVALREVRQAPGMPTHEPLCGMTARGLSRPPRTDIVATSSPAQPDTHALAMSSA